MWLLQSLKVLKDKVPSSLGALFIILSFAMAGCGGTPYMQNKDGSQSGSSITIPPAEDEEFTYDENLDPPYTYGFDIQGPSGTYTTPGMDTDNLLKVRIEAGPSAYVKVSGYENYGITFACAQFKISVNGEDVTTPLLAVNGASSWSHCAGALEKWEVNLSDRLGGPGPVSVQVSQPRYDYYCQYYTLNPPYWLSPSQIQALLASSCPTKQLYTTHAISAKLTVQVNGTAF